MKNLLFAVLLAIPSLASAQYVKIPRYDSETTANHIMMGHVESFCSDTVEFVVEKKNDRWVTSYLSPDVVSKRVWKILQKGKSHFTGSTTRGYTFYITVEDVNDDLKLYESLTFHVDQRTQKIYMIEVKL